jgi:tetratricopeptide repeat protein
VKHLVRVAFAVFMLWTWAPPVVEAAPDDVAIKLAKSYYEKGDAAYNLGRFDEAVGWFTKAYETWSLPDFLYNIAQSYRQASNCKQALFAYKRYLSLKEDDKDAPLTKKERADIERFIEDLTVCVNKVDSSAAASPGALKTTPIPPAAPSPPTTPAPILPTPPTTTTPRTKAPSPPATAPPTKAPRPSRTGAVTEEPEDEGEPSVSKSKTEAPKLLAAYATGGIAVFRTGALAIPIQPSFAVGGGYPLHAGPVMLDLGARASFSPIQYDTMDATKRASLLGVRATAGAAFAVNKKISLRGDLGLGFVMLRGLVEGNPFIVSGYRSGSASRPNTRSRPTSARRSPRSAWRSAPCPTSCSSARSWSSTSCSGSVTGSEQTARASRDPLIGCRSSPRSLAPLARRRRRAAPVLDTACARR